MHHKGEHTHCSQNEQDNDSGTLPRKRRSATRDRHEQKHCGGGAEEYANVVHATELLLDVADDGLEREDELDEKHD